MVLGGCGGEWLVWMRGGGGCVWVGGMCAGGQGWGNEGWSRRGAEHLEL